MVLISFTIPTSGSGTNAPVGVVWDTAIREEYVLLLLNWAVSQLSKKSPGFGSKSSVRLEWLNEKDSIKRS
jgi:hypothetical protein